MTEAYTTIPMKALASTYAATALASLVYLLVNLFSLVFCLLLQL